MSKKRFYFNTILIILFISAAFGMAVSVAENGGRLKGLAPAVLAVARFPNHVYNAFYQLRHKSNQVIARGVGECGIYSFGDAVSDSNAVLVSSFEPALGQASIKLMRICDGEKLFEWVPPIDDERLVGFTSRHRVRPEAPNQRFAHPLLLPDGSVVFNRQCGPLTRLDRNSEIVWIIEGDFHHSLELDANGDIWGCMNRVPGYLDTTMDFGSAFFEDNAIVKISQEGSILYEKSVAELFTENHLRGILYGAGFFGQDAIHLNDVEPALFDGPYWKKGDLLLSFRHFSMLLLFRPSENRVLWYRMGDWINQHDGDFVDSTHISVFGNDMVRFINEDDLLIDGYSNIYVIDLGNDSVSTPYTDVFREQEIACLAEGLCEIFPDGRVFIEQTKPGRLLIARPGRALWSYTQCIGEDMASMFSWSRYIKAESLPENLNLPGTQSTE